MSRPVSQRAYNKARGALAKYRAEELAMRIVERGAIEYGRKTMRKLWMDELRSRGFGKLSKYLGELFPVVPR